MFALLAVSFVATPVFFNDCLIIPPSLLISTYGSIWLLLPVQYYANNKNNHSSFFKKRRIEEEKVI